MAITNFQRSVWSARIVSLLYRRSVYLGMSNRDYEADVPGAKEVKIGSVGDVSVNDYDGTDITIQALTDSQKTLPLDQKKYFAFNLDDVERAQSSAPIMEAAVSNATQSMAVEIDDYLQDIFDDAAGARTFTDTTTFATMTEVDKIMIGIEGMKNIILGQDHTLAPGDLRCAIPPQIWNRWERVLTAAGYDFGDDTLENGFGGRVAGINFFVTTAINKSNSDANWDCPVTVRRQPVTTAVQLQEIEAMRMEKKFADLIRGLYIFGSLVVRPDSLYLLKLKVA